MTGLNFAESFEGKLSERDFSLLKRCAKTLDNNVFTHEELNINGKTMISPCWNRDGSDSFNGVWNWDTAFHAIAVSRWDKQLAFDQIEGFFEFMKEDGMLPDVHTIHGDTGYHSSKPPVFPWAALLVTERTKDTSMAERMFDKLVTNIRFWETQRFDGKLFYYDAYIKGTEKELTYIKWESGLDNSVRWDDGILNLYPVDLNCFMLMAYRSLASLSDILGKDKTEWKTKANKMEVLIEETFWNEELKAYTDVDRFTGKFSSCLTPASFMPLYVGTASKERAEHLSHLAQDKEKFNCNMPSVSYDNKEFSDNYWRGPVWLNIAYFAAKGLKDYGFTVADKIKDNILNMCDGYKKAICENYDSVKNIGINKHNFSWSSVFIIEFILNW